MRRIGYDEVRAGEGFLSTLADPSSGMDFA